MPRIISTNTAELILVFRQFTEQIRAVPVPSHPIWEVISNELLVHGIVMSGRYCYIIMKQNRYDIRHHLGIEDDSMSLPAPLSQEDHIISEEEEEEESSVTFQLEFKFEELSSLIQTVQYFRQKSHESSLTRQYTILAPWQWTSVVHDKFYAVTHLPCAVVYKNHKILADGEVYLTVNGSCRDCKSSFRGQIHQKPVEEKSVTMECKYEGLYRTCSATSKRRLIGPCRKKILKKLIREGRSGPYIRGKFARKNLKYGEMEPSHLPTSNAFRCAKYRANLENLVDEDPVRALCILKGEAPYAGIIHDIAIDKFIVHYWSAEEVENYRLLCKKSNEPKVCIDATGKYKEDGKFLELIRVS